MKAFQTDVYGTIRRKIHRHGSMQRFGFYNLLKVTVKYRHITVSRNPFWIFKKRAKIQAIDDPYGTVSSTATEMALMEGSSSIC